MRLIPEGFVAEESEDRVAICVGFGFDGPPEEQRNMDVVHVFAALSEVFDDRQRLGRRQAAGGGGELAADFDVGFAVGEVGEFCGDFVADVVVVAGEADGPEADVRIVVDRAMYELLRRSELARLMLSP